MKRLLLGMAALGLCLSFRGQAKADYTFRYPIDPLGSIRTETQGINSRGDIVGFYEDPDHTVHGFLLIGEEFTFFDVQVSGTTWTQGSGINDSGEIVGRYIADGRQHGYLRHGDDTYQLLSDPPDGHSPQPYAINNSGDIAGNYVSEIDGRTHGFLLSEGSYTTIDPPGSTFTLAQGINSFGVIVGVYEVEGMRHGFVRLIGGRFIYPPDRARDSRLTSNIGINDLGQISGSFIDAGGERHGFVNEYGQYTTLGPPDAINVFASGINASGWIVGPYTEAVPPSRVHGYLARPVPEPGPGAPPNRLGAQ